MGDSHDFVILAIPSNPRTLVPTTTNNHSIVGGVVGPISFLPIRLSRSIGASGRVERPHNRQASPKADGRPFCIRARSNEPFMESCFYLTKCWWSSILRSATDCAQHLRWVTRNLFTAVLEFLKHVLLSNYSHPSRRFGYTLGSSPIMCRPAFLTFNTDIVFQMSVEARSNLNGGCSDAIAGER